MLIVDANVLVAAVAGRSLPLLAELDARGFRLVTPEHQRHETRAVLLQKIRLEPALVESRLRLVWDFVETVDAGYFDALEPLARQRLEPAGQRDWPVLALALAAEAHILSNDRDFFGVGVPVWTTTTIQFADPEAA